MGYVPVISSETCQNSNEALPCQVLKDHFGKVSQIKRLPAFVAGSLDGGVALESAVVVDIFEAVTNGLYLFDLLSGQNSAIGIA